jgi:hypothetical protein
LSPGAVGAMLLAELGKAKSAIAEILRLIYIVFAKSSFLLSPLPPGDEGRGEGGQRLLATGLSRYILPSAGRRTGKSLARSLDVVAAAYQNTLKEYDYLIENKVGEWPREFMVTY